MKHELVEIFSGHGLALSPEQVSLFELYRHELLQWNARANLISKRDEGRIAERHFLESALLSVVSEFQKKRVVLDLGTGGGFPGIPLKIMCPWVSLTLLESKRWKTLFLRDVLQKLNLLEEVGLICDRAESRAVQAEYQNKFDIVVSRAVAPLSRLFEWSHRLLAPGGMLLALKGSGVGDEVESLRQKSPGVSIEKRPLFPSTELGEKTVLVFVTSQK